MANSRAWLFGVALVAIGVCFLRLAISLLWDNNKKNSAHDFDKAAEDLRLATRHLGMVVGKVDVEELLGSIFNDFCIGK